MLPLLSCSAPVAHFHFHILLTFRNDWGVYGFLCTIFTFGRVCAPVSCIIFIGAVIFVKMNSKENVVHLLHHWEYHNEHSEASKICWNHKPFVIGFDSFAKLHMCFECGTQSVCISKKKNEYEKMVSVTCIDLYMQDWRHTQVTCLWSKPLFYGFYFITHSWFHICNPLCASRPFLLFFKYASCGTIRWSHCWKLLLAGVHCPMNRNLGNF